MAKKTHAGKASKSRKAKKARARIYRFGPPSLLFGESETTYNELFKRINETLQPTDIFEEFAARDLANAMMDSERFSRLKSELLNANMHMGMKRLLEPLCNITVQVRSDRVPMLDADAAAAGWALGEPARVAAVEEMLDRASLSMDAVVAETLSYEVDSFEAIDRLETSAQSRRYSILHEIERRREAVRAASPPVAAAVSRLTAINKVKANDNETRSKKWEEVIEAEAAVTGTDAATEAIERRLKMGGE